MQIHISSRLRPTARHLPPPPTRLSRRHLQLRLAITGLMLRSAKRLLRATPPVADHSKIVVIGETAVNAATVRIAMDEAVVAVVSADADVAVSRVMVRASRAEIVTADHVATAEIAATVRSTSPATPHRRLSR